MEEQGSVRPDTSFVSIATTTTEGGSRWRQQLELVNVEVRRLISKYGWRGSSGLGGDESTLAKRFARGKVELEDGDENPLERIDQLLVKLRQLSEKSGGRYADATESRRASLPAELTSRLLTLR